MSNTASFVVVGASRGIGLALTKHLFEKHGSNGKVVGTMRNPNVDDLPEGVQQEQLDITNQSSVDSCATKFGSIETLIVNAAMGNHDTMLGTNAEQLSNYLETNVVGIHRTVLGFLPALRKGKKKQIILLSSTSGSLHLQKEKPSGFQGPYSVSKTATNSLGIQYHNELKEEGFTVIMIHPGWVKTSMGSQINGGEGAISPDESATSMIKVIDGLNSGNSGSYLRQTGETLEW